MILYELYLNLYCDTKHSSSLWALYFSCIFNTWQILPIVLNCKLFCIIYIFLPDIKQFYEVDDSVKTCYFYQQFFFFLDFRWIALTQSEISFFQISFNFVLEEPLKVFEQRSWNNEITMELYYCWTIQMFISISKGHVYRVDACVCVVHYCFYRV